MQILGKTFLSQSRDCLEYKKIKDNFQKAEQEYWLAQDELTTLMKK